MKTEIIYEDSDLFVIKKPAGLATQTARVAQADVVSELKNYMAAFGVRASGAKTPYLGIIHRLDQPVEGLLVFARNKKAAAALTEQLEGQGNAGLLNKQYYAVVCGRPLCGEGELVDYMLKDAGKTGKAVIIEDYEENTGDGRGKAGRGKSAEMPEEGTEKPNKGPEKLEKSTGGTGKEQSAEKPKKAVLRYRILQTVGMPSGEEISLADICIDTGRFHQIRAQMAHAGMALLGDEKYAGESVKTCSKRLGIRSVALCAYSLSFVHPATGERLCFEIKPGARAFSFFRL